MPDVLAVVGLLATVGLVGHAILAVLLYQQTQRVRHLADVCRRLTAAWAASGGESVRLDPSLLGDPPDEYAPDADTITSIPEGLGEAWRA